MSEWTDELKAQVIARYEESEPTPENTMDILAELAEEFEKTQNGIRMILTKAGVYVKKDVKKSSGSPKASGSTRVSKEDAFKALREEITQAGGNVDDEIISKLTGKAAMYFVEVLKVVSK